MRKTVKRVLSGILALMMSASIAGCAPTNDVTAIKAPTANNADVVSSEVPETEEVGLTSGFALPHDDGKLDNIYVYDNSLYYRNNPRFDGADPGVMFASEEDIRDSYDKLIEKESQLLPNASEAEILTAVEEKYGAWEDWETNYSDRFYMVHTSSTGSISSTALQKYPQATYLSFVMRSSSDLSNWSLSGAIDGYALEGRADSWCTSKYNWAPEIVRDPLSGLYVIVGSGNSKSGNINVDYHPFTDIGYNPAREQYDNMFPFIAISSSPTGPYRHVTGDEYYSYIAKLNADGSFYTIDINGEKWAVYREDIKKEDGNEYGGYVPLTKVEEDIILNQNGLSVTAQTCFLNSGYYQEEIWEAYQHWNTDYRGIFPAIDANLVIDSQGDIYMYFSAHSGSVLEGNHVWVVPMKDLCSPDWERMTHVSDPGYSTIYYGEDKACFYDSFDGRDFYQPNYVQHAGGKENLKFSINGVPGYWMGNSSEGGINEGTHVIEKDGWYYLTYSPFGYGSKNYSVHTAIADNPFGPFLKLNQYAPAFGMDRSEYQDYMSGTGHHAFVTVGDEMWIVYHCFYNPENNSDASGNFLGRCIGVDRIGWYDYDGITFESLIEKQIETDIRHSQTQPKSELRDVFGDNVEEMEEWLRECYETGNHRNYEKRVEKDEVVSILYGNGPTRSLQPLPESASGYDNVAQSATVTVLEGEANTARYANDGMFTYQSWSEPYEVVGNSETRQLKLKLSWDTPQTIRNIMIYNSRNYLYAFNNVRSIVFKLAQKPEWYPNDKEFNYYAYISDLKPDESGWDDSNFVMRKGGSAMATFNEITVTEIIITIDARDKVGELILTSANRYTVKLSEIYIMGNPKAQE